MSPPRIWFGVPPAVFSLFAHGTPVAGLLTHPCYFSLAITWPKTDFAAHDEVGMILSFPERSSSGKEFPILFICIAVVGLSLAALFSATPHVWIAPQIERRRIDNDINNPSQ